MQDFYQATLPSPATRLNDVEFVALDFETTGLNPDAGVLLQFSQDFGRRSGASFVRSEFLVRGQRKLFNRDVTLRADLEAGVLAMSGGSRSRRVEIAWPNFTKIGPSSSRARRIRSPSGADVLRRRGKI